MKELKEYFIQDLPERLALKVSAEIRENFQIDGHSSLTLRDMDRMKDSILLEMREEMRKLVEKFNVVNSTPNSGSDINNNSVDIRSWKTWYANDGFLCRFVPPDWSFPDRLTTKALWDLWWYGEKNKGIRPYRLLNRSVDIEKKRRIMFTRAKKVMMYYEEVASKMNLLPIGTQSISSLSLEESDRMFEKLFEHATTELYGEGNERRPQDVAYGTIYNKLKQKRRS